MGSSGFVGIAVNRLTLGVCHGAGARAGGGIVRTQRRIETDTPFSEDGNRGLNRRQSMRHADEADQNKTSWEMEKSQDIGRIKSKIKL